MIPIGHDRRTETEDVQRSIDVIGQRRREATGVWRWRERAHLTIGLVAVALLGTTVPAPAASLYRIDQRYGTVEFSIASLGLFDVQGRFPRFEGELLLDPGHPEHTHIDVAIDANAVEMPLSDQADLLRSAPYFNTATYPTERFISTSIQALSASHYLIHGTLSIRGVAQVEVLDAVLQDRHVDAVRNTEIADFVVTGEIRRSAFGMVADRIMLSDTVHLHIRIRLTVDPTVNE